MSENLSYFNEQTTLYRDMIEEKLEEILQIKEDIIPDQVRKAMKYSVLGGGKRVRGILVLAFAKLCGTEEVKALNFACALEMVHAYSLIHDDLPCMDNDDMRRGKPSCHIEFGEATALLAGDALLTKAFEVISKADLPAEIRVEALKELSLSCGDRGMIYGQMIDLFLEENDAFVGDQELSARVLNKLHNHKTAALISASAKLGAIAAGADGESRQKAGKFGNKIGLAFQFIDDILDCTGDDEVLGKPTGSDAKNSKLTSVTVYGQENAYNIACNLTNEAQEDLAFFDGNSQFLSDFCMILLERES